MIKILYICGADKYLGRNLIAIKSYRFMRQIIATLMATIIIVATPRWAAAQENNTNYAAEVLEHVAKYYSNGLDEKLYLQLDKPYYSAGEQLWFKGYLRNAITHAPLELSNYIYVELVGGDNELVERVKVKRDSTGFNGYIALDAKLEEGDYTLRGYTRWMLNKSDDFFFTKAIKIISPIPESKVAEDAALSARERRKRSQSADGEEASRVIKPMDYDLQFFPEGGALLSGGAQFVAFKAVGEDGLSVEVDGAIYSADGELVCPIKSTHKGMGMAGLFVSHSSSYYAVVSSAQGLEKRVELPAVETDGAVISVRQNKGKLIYQVRASHPSLLAGAHVIINAHGRIFSVGTLESSLSGTLSIDEMFDGVNIISLVDASGTVLSERLVFKRPDVEPTLEIAADRNNYASRSKAKVKVKVLDSSGNPAKGEFGVSVTDDSAVEFNSGDDNILSNLLLTSDICGHVEDPGLYFTGDLASADYNVDLLMRTQGWRRFDIGEILAESTPKPQYRYESEVEISGEVKGFFGNAARRPTIYVLCAQQHYMDRFELDLSSKFRLTGLDLPDSVTYIIQARGKRGGTALTLNIEPEPFPTVRSTLFPRVAPQESYIPVAFVSQSQDKFFYEGGMNLIDLDAVYVTVDKKEVNKDPYAGFATRSTSREELDRLAGFMLPNIIGMYAGMSVTTEEVTFRGNSTPVKFVVDDIEWEYTDASYLTSSDIETINFYDGASAAMYSNAAGGVFVINLREGASYSGSSVTSPSIITVDHLGYQPPMQLYQPRYNVPSLKADLPPDFRTTIFWDGTLTPNEEGYIEFELYTADKATSYTVTLEGVTDDGEICQATSTIRRTSL